MIKCVDGVNLSEFQIELLEEHQNILEILFFASIPVFTLGIIFNIVCLTYFLRYQRQSLGDKLVIGLNFSDILTCFVVPLQWLLESKVTMDANFAASYGAITTYLFLFSFDLAVTLHFVRIASILWPLRDRKAKYFIFPLFVLEALKLVYLFLSVDQASKPVYLAHHCGQVNDANNINTLFNFISHLSFAIVDFILLTLIILGTLKAVKTLKTSVNQDTITACKRRALFTVVIVVSIQIASLTPLAALLAYSSVGHQQSGEIIAILGKREYRLLTFFSIIYITGLMSSVCNPVVYFVRIRAINNWLKGLWKKCSSGF